MRLGRAAVWCAVLAGVQPGVAGGQVVEVAEGLTLGDTVAQLSRPPESVAVGDALRAATLVEVATTPLGNASSGFTFTFDTVQGIDVRTTPTFGPSFSERARTLGAGRLNAGANLLTATYDQIGSFSLDDLSLSSTASSDPRQTKTARGSLVISSTTAVVYATVGMTDSLDVGVAVPFVEVEVDGVSWVENAVDDPDRSLLVQSSGGGVAAGLGDVELSLKYRLFRFGAADVLPDPGGLAVAVKGRLPTGSADDLRGLGVGRTLASVIVSRPFGRLRPHGSVGYEWWSDSLDVATADDEVDYSIQNRLVYAAGAEYEIAPMLTVLVDLLGSHIGDTGRVGIMTESPDTPETRRLGIESITFLGPLDEGVRKLTLAPGIRWNVKGTALLSLNALIALSDDGLHDVFLPVVGLDMTF